MDFEDLYRALGVSSDASALDIRKAYRQLVLELHPDRNPGDAAAEERFKKVGAAYQILSNSLRRAEYDQQYRFHNPLPKPTYTAPPEERAAPRRARSGPSKEELAERRRERRQAAEEAKVFTQYDAEANEIESRDLINGIIAGTIAAFLFGELGMKAAPGNSGATLLVWCFAPLLGAPIGYRFGSVFGEMAERSLEAMIDVVPLLDAFAKLFPVLGATTGACGLLMLSGQFGAQFSSAGLIPAAIAGGLAAAFGGAFGRAFTSVSTSLTGKTFGIAVGFVVGALSGAALGAGLAASHIGPMAGLPFYDVMACGAIGGAAGGAVASALGALLGGGAAQVVDLRSR